MTSSQLQDRLARERSTASRPSYGWRRIAWLGLGVFILHDLEEMVTVVPWLRVHALTLPEPAKSWADGITAAQFGVAILSLFVIYGASTIPVLRSGDAPRVAWPFLVASAVLAANGVTHVVQAAILGGYAPGLITAVTLNIPFGILLAHRAKTASLTKPGLWFLVAAGFLLQAPAAAGALALGRLVVCGVSSGAC